MKDIKKIKLEGKLGIVEVVASVFDVVTSHNNHIDSDRVATVCELTGLFTDCIAVKPVNSDSYYMVDANLMAFIRYNKYQLA